MEARIRRLLARTQDTRLNALLMGLMGCMIVNLVRGQSSYFIKYFYTFVLPGLMLYTSFAGLSLQFRLGWPSRKDKPHSSTIGQN